ATDRGASARLRTVPSDTRITRSWSMKSNSIVNVRCPCGRGRVESPRGVICRAIAHEWFRGGASASATFPTTCVHMWSVAYVSFQRSEEHTSELQSRSDLVCRLLLEKKKRIIQVTLMRVCL